MCPEALGSGGSLGGGTEMGQHWSGPGLYPVQGPPFALAEVGACRKGAETPWFPL